MDVTISWIVNWPRSSMYVAFGNGIVFVYSCFYDYVFHLKSDEVPDVVIFLCHHFSKEREREVAGFTYFSPG